MKFRICKMSTCPIEFDYLVDAVIEFDKRLKAKELVWLERLEDGKWLVIANSDGLFSNDNANH